MFGRTNSGRRKVLCNNMMQFLRSWRWQRRHLNVSAYCMVEKREKGKHTYCFFYRGIALERVNLFWCRCYGHSPVFPPLHARKQNAFSSSETHGIDCGAMFVRDLEKRKPCHSILVMSGLPQMSRSSMSQSKSLSKVQRLKPKTQL